ncbi:uridine kinase family protein [Streptomyces sp. HB2AG]|uniref:uridine kinase family protein n=1 Tax=Streptomyces sp. HB2AG TaxID=2983400 RepID=UPI0022AAAC7F|nr:hypothetical protein [Streptomyces sp. HB2AG]MCZ2526161.1 hypothetical protein [Streptomyces sp. HB2AG]
MADHLPGRDGLPDPKHRAAPDRGAPDRGAPDASPARLPELARWLCALAPSCGPVRLVAVDGHAGSGKSTFAARLADALGPGTPVVRLDDLATHREPFGWAGRLRARVLEPLARGESGRYEVYDWTRRRFADEREVPAAPVVLLEGVGAARREVRPFLAAALWMETDVRTSHARGLLRDRPPGSEDPDGYWERFWREWARAEAAHFAADPSRPRADLLVLQRDGDYGFLPGPGKGRAALRFRDRP